MGSWEDFIIDIGEKFTDAGWDFAEKFEEKAQDWIDTRLIEPIERLSGCDMTRPLYKGDVIFVNRGTYLHYGVYIGDHKVIHFAPRNGGEACIHETSLGTFLTNDLLICGKCYVIEFSETNGDYDNEEDRAEPVKFSRLKQKGLFSSNPFLPARFSVDLPLFNMLNYFFNNADYHVYSGKETVERARGELNKEGYNLITNNCEHFAIWCKTGVHESNQVDNFLSLISHLTKA